MSKFKCCEHDFSGGECIGHPTLQFCKHCYNCEVIIEKLVQSMTCKHEFTGPNCKYHNIASCVYCEFCPKYANNTSFSQDDTVGVQAKISGYTDFILPWLSPETEQKPELICHVHKLHWDDPEQFKKTKSNWTGKIENGSNSGACGGKVIWEAKDGNTNYIGGWVPVCETHKLYYENFKVPTRELIDLNTYLKASDIKKAVEQLKSASAKPYTKYITPHQITPGEYKYSYKFSNALTDLTKYGTATLHTGWEIKRETVVDRIRWLLECGQGVLKQVDAGEMPSETVLQAFDSALKNLRETGE